MNQRQAKRAISLGLKHSKSNYGLVIFTMWRLASPRPHYKAHLLEVIVQGESVRQSQLTHEDKAGTIGEGEILVVVSDKHLPGCLSHPRINLKHPYQFALSNPVAKVNGFLVTKVGP
jgi:hypothetical protein